MAYCPSCGSAVEGKFCPKCGTAVGGPAPNPPNPGYTPGPAPVPASGGMADNVAAALAYIFPVCIVFLLIEPFNRRSFVRFHSFQSLFFCIACFVIWFAMSIVVGIMVVGGGFGTWGLIAILFWVVRLGIFLLWILLVFKAYNNERFKLPVIGDLAEKQAGA
jgi:uncharacterized membrane protein